MLHQATERYLDATLLIYTGYKPKSHNIEELANETAPLHPALAGAMPRTEKEDHRLFGVLKRAYIEARYSKGYKITLDELRILRERVLDLAVRVRQACAEKLASFCGPEAVGELPDVPKVTDISELPEAPSFDDASAFRAWLEELTALTFERGLAEGEQKGRAEDLLTVLRVRGIAVPDAARERILAQKDPEQLKRWHEKAIVAASLADVFDEPS
jgi:HEPN domain-containing protein